MNINLPSFAYLLIGLAAIGIIGFIGLKISSPLSYPIGEPTGKVERLPLPDGLPSAVRRWLAGAEESLPAPASLVAWGRGSIVSNLPFRLKLWLPTSWTLYLLPGRNFMMKTRVTWYKRPFSSSGEEYRDGKGTYLFRTQTLDKPFLSETERALAWIYYLWLSPGSLIRQPGVEMLEHDGVVTFVVSEPDLSPLTFTLTFAPHSGALQAIATTRKGSVSGKDYPYSVSFSQPRAFQDAGSIPTHVIAKWDGDVVLKLDLVGFQPNQDVTEAMQIGIVGLN